MADHHMPPPGCSSIHSLLVFSEGGYVDFERDSSLLIIPTIVVSASVPLHTKENVKDACYVLYSTKTTVLAKIT